MSVPRIVSATSLIVSLATISIASAQPVELVLTSGTIQPKKANGDAWDPFGGSPDAYVLVKARKPNQAYTTLRKTESSSDTHKPDWKAIAVPLQTGQEVALEVWDADFDADDPIGTYRFTLTRERIAEGDFRVSFGQVKELRLILEAPSLKAAELDRRLRAVDQLAFGANRHQLPSVPFTADRLREHHKKIRLTSSHVVKGESPTFERIVALNTSNLIAMRLALGAETPPRDQRDNMLAWIDSFITNRHLIMKEFEYTMELARCYLQYKHEEKLGRNREEDRELVRLLGTLEEALQERVAMTEVLALLDGGDSLSEEEQRALALARSRLPDELRTADVEKLRPSLDPALQKVLDARVKFTVAIEKHLPALLTERFAVTR